MFWGIVIVIIALALGVSKLVERRQVAANAPGWVALTPVIAGRVEGNGVRGVYRDRLAMASLELCNDVADQFWRYTLTIGAGTPSTGQDWEVDYTSTGPYHFGGEITWSPVLAGVSAEDLRATGFSHLSYHAKKSELSGSYLLAGSGLNSNFKDFTKVPPPPPPEAFKAQLDLLVRLAETSQNINHQA